MSSAKKKIGFVAFREITEQITYLSVFKPQEKYFYECIDLYYLLKLIENKPKIAEEYIFKTYMFIVFYKYNSFICFIYMCMCCEFLKYMICIYTSLLNIKRYKKDYKFIKYMS